MFRLISVKGATSLNDVAKLLNFKPSALAYVLFKLPDAIKYKSFEIPKRGGGTRTIKAPVDALKLVQENLSTLLQDCLDEINAGKNQKDRIAHGFKRKRSIITNAIEHRNRRYVFNIDLKDFFPSINFGRVRGYFIKDKNFALNEKVATVIAQIACHEKALPQGSPCSPVISNLIAHVLDIHLVRLATQCGCTYTRYADDLTFSTNKREFPAEIAVCSAEGSHVWLPGSELQQVIQHCGFQINPKKTHMKYRTSRQEVTGLIVNRRVNVRDEYRHTVRAMVHQLLMTGSFETYAVTEKDGKKAIERCPGTNDQLHGMLGFIDSVDRFSKKGLHVSKDGERPSATEKMYRHFLIYTYFFAAKTPVIICEGETDNVYLTHAIRGLATDFPELATIESDGKITLKIRLYKYRKSSTGRILNLRDGGSGSLKNFISTYKKDSAKFKGPGETSPVIVLYDNDSGASTIRNIIKEFSHVAVDPTAPFHRVVRNLYAVPTPLLSGEAESKIENFFDQATKAIEINGKTFNDKNNIDDTKHYGKKVFAYGVVQPNANSISFDAFRPLLENLTAVIKGHTSPEQAMEEVSGAPVI